MAKAAKVSPATKIDIEIQRWPIERLKPYEGNARTHSKAQINQIAVSIKEFGWTNPILADADDGVIAGHRLICGDCTDPAVVARLLGDAKPLLLVTHPPYGIALDSEWRDRAYRVDVSDAHLDQPCNTHMEFAARRPVMARLRSRFSPASR